MAKKPPREAVRLVVQPPICGIYFLSLHPLGVVYVGKSVDIVARVRRHKELGKEFDTVHYIQMEEVHLESEELYWIKRLRPKYNLADNPRYSKAEWESVKDCQFGRIQ